MRAGLVFLAGLLVGGLVVAWLVAEVPPEPPQVVVAQAPATPMAPAQQAPVVVAPAPPGPSREPDARQSAEQIVEELIEEVTVEAPAAPAPVESVPASPAQGTLLLPPLRIPVEGIVAGQLVDSFTDARGEDRVHDALDIMAAEGTPVLAVADGPVVKLFDSVQGGVTLYQFDEVGQVAFYYAHLQRYAEGVEEGKQLRQGDVLGYVGHTGNANAAAPHLHFAIFVLGADKRWWDGEAINPYPLLSD